MTDISEKTLVIGVDLGGTTIAAGLIDGSLTVLDSIEEETRVNSQEALIGQLLEMVRALISSSSMPVSAVAFGIPSMIDQTRGRAVMSVNVPLADFDFVDYMREEIGLPVFIDNDANVAAIAEARAGAGAGAGDVIMITIGTGIGGGIIIDGEIYRGSIGSAGELGHMVIEASGPPCPGVCDSYGCFEAMASGTALTRYAHELAAAQPDSRLGQAAKGGARLEGALVYGLAMEGDDAAQQVFSRVGFYLGVGMTSLINIFNPEVFVVGGGLAKAGDLLMDPAKKILAERGLRPNRDVVRIETAHFGPEAGMIGAACLALSELNSGTS